MVDVEFKKKKKRFKLSFILNVSSSSDFIAENRLKATEWRRFADPEVPLFTAAAPHYARWACQYASRDPEVRAAIGPAPPLSPRAPQHTAKVPGWISSPSRGPPRWRHNT